MILRVPEIGYALILTRDAERAALAVRSIARQTPDAELLLVLNEADEDMRAFARALPGARILHDGEDIGVVWGWNLALREARAEAVLVMHEDSELGDGCAERLLRTLRERPDAGAVAPRVLLAGGAAHQGAVVWRDGATSRVPSLPADVHPVDYATSSCMLVRRDVALGVGGFDERFFPAVYADTSFGVALWRAGRTVLCDRRASSRHRVGAMVDLARGPRRSPRFRSFLLSRNRARFEDCFRAWLAGQAERADAVDARHPQPQELEQALARTRRREREILAAPLAPLGDRLALPPDPEAESVRRRAALVDEFLAELIQREEAVTAEAAAAHRAYADLHGAHAELHAEHERVHREYAELRAEHERVHREYAELHAEHERVHREYAARHAELERVHRAYAELWEDRARLRELASPLLAADDHA
jgi:GT2 family glycosyltransferase